MKASGLTPWLMAGVLGLVSPVVLPLVGCARVVEKVGWAGPPDAGGDAPNAGGVGGRGMVVDAGGAGGHYTPALLPEWNCGATCFRDPSIPASPDPAGRLAGPADGNAAHKPSLVYPLAGALHPMNISDVTFQWRRGPATQTLFRIRVRLVAAGVAVGPFDFYVPCKPPAVAPPPALDQCTYAMPPGAWLDVALQSRGQQVSAEVDAVDDDPGAGGAVALSDPQLLSFSSDPVEGGLYYWSTHSTTTASFGATYRLLFGARKALPFIAPNSPSNGFACGGCHAISRDGTTIAISEGNDAYSAVLRVARTSNPDTGLFPVAASHDSATIALSPDGSRALTSYANGLTLRATSDGHLLATVDPALLTVAGVAYHGYLPEWSPDGKEIALTLSAVPDSEWAVRTGAIAVLPVAADRFGSAEVIVPDDADFNFYPSWSPDGKWIVFASAPAGQGLKSYDQRLARLRLVARAGGPVYELGRATQGVGHTSSWPKFAPFSQAGGNVLFVTFNSKIDYGFLLPNSQALTPTPQLWLAAIDLRRLPGDPSYQPMWLPFQDVTQNNHLGFWTENVGCRLDTGGVSVGCDDGESCVGGKCSFIVP
jgi:hypothetical protein